MTSYIKKEKERNFTESHLNDFRNTVNRTQSDEAVITVSYPLKITFIGDSSVGKSSIITKFCEEKYEPDKIEPTINVGIKEKTIKIDAFTEVNLSIWDTAGAEKYISFTSNYLRESNGIIIVFDLTNEKSFENLNMWMQLINNTIEEGKVEKILVGNKCDMPEGKVSTDMAQKYAREHGMKYLTVSAKDGMNIDYLFEILANDCAKRIKNSEKKKENDEDNNQNKENEDKISILSIENNNNNNKKENHKKKKKGKCC